MKTCKECKFWRKQCKLDTKYIPKYLPQSQRDKWLNAWYDKAENQEACEIYNPIT